MNAIFKTLWIMCVAIAGSGGVSLYEVSLSTRNMTFKQANRHEKCTMIGRYENLERDMLDLTKITATSYSERFWFAEFWKYSPWINIAGCFNSTVMINRSENGLNLLPYLEKTKWQPWEIVCLHHCNFSDFVINNFSCHCVNNSQIFDDVPKCLIENVQQSFLKKTEKCTCKFQYVNDIRVENKSKRGECLTMKYRNNYTSPELSIAHCSEEYAFICKRWNGEFVGVHSKLQNFTLAETFCLSKNLSLFNYNDMEVLQNASTENKTRSVRVNSTYWIGIYRKQISWPGINKTANTTNCLAARLHYKNNTNISLKIKPMKNCRKRLRVLCKPKFNMLPPEGPVKVSASSDTLPRITTLEPNNNATMTSDIRMIATPTLTIHEILRMETEDGKLMTTIVVAATCGSVVILSVIVLLVIVLWKKRRRRKENPVQKTSTEGTEQTRQERTEQSPLVSNKPAPDIYHEIKLQDEIYNVLHEKPTNDYQEDDYDHITDHTAKDPSNGNYSCLATSIKAKKPEQAFSDYDVLKNLSGDDYDVSVLNSLPKDKVLSEYDTMASVKHLQDEDCKVSLSITEHDTMTSVKRLQDDDCEVSLSTTEYDTMTSVMHLQDHDRKVSIRSTKASEQESYITPSKYDNKHIEENNDYDNISE